MNDALRVSEIFLSIQGESTRAGLPCAFIRLAGCNLRCSWCDTPYAQDAGAGEEMSIEATLARVEELGCRRVEVTGGEPLTQAACPRLLHRLCEAGYETLLETNGSLDIFFPSPSSSPVDPRVIRIVDFKCPSSGHENDNLWENVECLTERDEVKFVIANRGDYEFARAAVAERRIADRCAAVIFSPVSALLAPGDLARWILDDVLDVRLGLQLHRIIWPDGNRGV